MAGAGFGAHGGADSVPSLRRLAPLGAFRAHALSGFVVQICSSLAVRGCDFASTRISADSVLELRRLVPLVGISLACAVDISTDDFAFIRDRHS